MEQIHIEKIENNLPKLIEWTECNEPLVVYLTSQRLLSRTEGDELLQETSKNKRNLKLYRLLQTRVGAYSTLLIALSETLQTGVVTLLEEDTFNICLKYDHFNVLQEELYTTGNVAVHRGTFAKRPALVLLYNRYSPLHFELAENELEMLSALDWHKNISRCLTARCIYMNSRQSLPYFAVAIEDRLTLKQFNLENISYQIQVSVLKQLFSAVCFLQESGIIHFDLKPQSIFVKFDDRNVSVTVGQLGLAKKLERNESARALHESKVEVDVSKLVTSGAGCQFTPEVKSIFTINSSQLKLLKVSMGHSTDVFCLGRLFYYVASRGGDLFHHMLLLNCETMMQNIKEKISEVPVNSLVKDNHALLCQCLLMNPEDRPSIHHFMKSFIYSKHI